MCFSALSADFGKEWNKTGRYRDEAKTIWFHSRSVSVLCSTLKRILALILHVLQ
jgi:hypothetical protein